MKSKKNEKVIWSMGDRFLPFVDTNYCYRSCFLDLWNIYGEIALVILSASHQEKISTTSSL